MRSRPGKVAALLMVGALGFGGVELGARLQARRALAHLLAAHPGLVVADVVAEPFAGAVRLRGVSLRGTGPNPWRVTVGALRLPVAGFVPHPLAGLGWPSFLHAATLHAATAAPANAAQPAATPVPVTSGGTASAENVVVAAGTATVRIKRIDMTGTPLTSADLAALLDAKSTATTEARLRRLSASAIVMPEIVSDDAGAGSERHASLAQVVLAGVVAGKVAAGSASAGTFAVKDAENAVNGSVGTVEATGIDLGQIAHVLGSLRTSDAEPVLPLYDSASVNAVTITNTARHATLTIRAIRETGAKARALRTDVGAALAGPRPANDPKSAALFDDVAHSLAVDALVLDDVASHSEAPNDTTDFGVLRASVTGFGDGKLGGADVRSFRFKGTKAGAFAVDALVVGPLALPSAGGGSNPRVPPLGTIDAAGIDVDLVGQSPDPDAADQPAGRVKFKVGHVVVASQGAGSLFPKTSSTSVENVSFDAPRGDGGGLPLYDMGYRRLNLSGTGESTYDAATQNLTINKLRVEGADMGALDLSMALGHVGDGILSPDTVTAQTAMIAVVAKSIDLKLANGGLFDKAIAWKAKKDGLSVEQERDAGIDFFTNGVPSLVNDNPKVKALGRAIAGFVAAPGTLDVSIASPGGIGIAALGMLATPDALINMLDIKASSHP